MHPETHLPIGRVADRSGLSVATVRYYEALGLISSTRTAANQRRYPRHVLRRLAFIAAARRVGLTLARVQDALATLPPDRAPTPDDWRRLGAPWSEQVAARIRELQALQSTLQECLGCGCLSMTRCALYNPDDDAAQEGPGSRWLRQAGDQQESGSQQKGDSDRW